MKDVTLNNGIVMTDAEFVRDRGWDRDWDDDLTNFVATKYDLVDLADSLVDDLLNREWFLNLSANSREWAGAEYTRFRLGRVLDFLPPEIRDKMLEKLRLGREENQANIAKIDADL
jgi:excisionase family DNA binding protein